MEDGKCNKIYSDGSYIKEIDKAGYCIVLLMGDIKKEFTGSNKTEKHIQNYEIYALAKAVEIMEIEKIYNGYLYSDSLVIISQINKILNGKKYNANQEQFAELYNKVVQFLISNVNVKLIFIKSKENIADKGSRFSAYKEMYQSVLENKNKIKEGIFFNSSNFILVENCFAENVASIFTKRKKRSFFNYFIKYYVGINIEKYQNKKTHYHEVFYYNKNDVTHKVHYNLTMKNLTDLDIIIEILKNQYTKQYQKIMFTLKSNNSLLDLLYFKKSIDQCSIEEQEKLNQILKLSENYEKICFIDGIKPDFCLNTGEKRIKIRNRIKEKKLHQNKLNGIF